MATITGFTAARMLEIENTTVVSGEVVGNDLILNQRGGININAGNVRGPVGSPGVTALELQETQALGSPIGTIVDYIGVTAPDNWLQMIGQSIINGQSLHPALWSILPESMKSGSNILFPDTRGRVSVGQSGTDSDFNVVGKTGGLKTVALTIPQLPVHTHTQQQHTHTQPQHSHTTPNHNHTIDHGHSNTISYASVDNHSHGPYQITAHSNQRDFLMRAANWNSIGMAIMSGAPGWSVGHAPPNTTELALAFFTSGVGRNTTLSGGHSHPKSGGVSGHSGTSGAANPPTNNTTAVNNNTTAINNDTGEGQAHSNLQPYITFLKIIRVA